MLQLSRTGSRTPKAACDKAEVTVTFRIKWSAFAAAAVGLFLGCAPGKTTVHGAVLYSASTPDSSAKAILTRSDHGSTVPYVYRLYIQNPVTGNSAEVLRADHVEKIELDWLNSRTIEVKLSCGRIFAYQNFVDLLTEDGKLSATVNITLSTTALCPVQVSSRDN